MPEPQCQLCGARITIGEPIPRDSECDSCRHDLRCCRNCRHYDPRYSNSCRENMADPVQDKERRNFCEYFSLTLEPQRTTAARAVPESDARRKLEELFRKPAPGRERRGGPSGV